MKKFKEHFDNIYNKIKNNENFAFIRFSDGELFIMQNKKLELSENGTFIDNQLAGPKYPKEDYKLFDPNIHQFFKDKLIESYQHKQENYYVGLSCACCVGMNSFMWMKNLRKSDDENLTWSNLFVNSNYPLFIEKIYPELSNKKIVIICNENADLSNSKLKIEKDFRIGRNAMIENFDLYKDIEKWIVENNIENYYFLFSASSLTNITVYELFKKFPNNTYIDIGTTLNPILGFSLCRDYLKAYWANQDHPDLHKTCVWI